MPTLCPICERADNIQKVSSIVLSGTSSTIGPSTFVSTSAQGKTSFSGGVSSFSSSTSLASLLTPPSQPSSGNYGCFSIASIINLSLFSIFFLIFTVIIIAENGLSGYTYIFNWQVSEFIAYGILPQIIIAFIVFVIFRIKKGRQTAYLTEYPIWQKAMNRWENLYYCHRDGIIFNPETGQKCDVRDMDSLLYS